MTCSTNTMEVIPKRWCRITGFLLSLVYNKPLTPVLPLPVNHKNYSPQNNKVKGCM